SSVQGSDLQDRRPAFRTLDNYTYNRQLNTARKRIGYAFIRLHTPGWWLHITFMCLVGKRVVVFHQFPKPLLQNVSVDLRCGNISVTQRQLLRPQSGSVLQEVTRESMTQYVRRNFCDRNSRPPSKALQFSCKDLTWEMAAFGRCGKKPRAFRKSR